LPFSPIETAFEISPPPGGQQQIQPVGVTTSHAFTGLANGTTYTFTVVATNAYGNGPASSAATSAPYGAPLAPTNVTATPGDHQATFGWTLPNANGSALTGQTVTLYTGATVVQTIPVSATATSQTFTGLTNGTVYYATIFGTNAAAGIYFANLEYDGATRLVKFVRL